MRNKQLRKLMIDKNITHKQLAKRLGLSHYGMSKKMRCITSFTWDEVHQICMILGIENPIGVIETRTEERDAGNISLIR